MAKTANNLFAQWLVVLEAHLLVQSGLEGMQLQRLLSLCNIAIDFLTSLHTILRKSLFLTLKPLEILLGTPF